MRTIRLSRNVVAGAVATYWQSPGFPDSIYVALETSVGFGEGCGGVGCGSVVNALHDLESGYFVDMARIDELVLNLPDPGTWGRRLAAEPAGGSGEDAGRDQAFWRRYPWEFADIVNGTRIEWE